MWLKLATSLFLVILLPFASTVHASVSWQEPLHPRDVRAYLKARTALVTADPRSLHDEGTQWRNNVLLRYGLNAQEFEYLQVRIEQAREMLRRYETLLARQAERTCNRIALLRSNYLTEQQKKMMLRAVEQLYAVEAERIGRTRRDWWAVAPYLDQLDRIAPPSYVGSV